MTHYIAIFDTPDGELIIDETDESNATVQLNKLSKLYDWVAAPVDDSAWATYRPQILQMMRDRGKVLHD